MKLTGTHMAFVLVGQVSVLEGWLSKIEVTWVLGGIYAEIYKPWKSNHHVLNVVV